MDVVANIAGNPITLGLLTSFIVELLKKVPWFPVQAGQTWRIRGLVTVVALGLNVGSAFIQGETLADVPTLVNLFVTYLAATSAYVHLMK